MSNSYKYDCILYDFDGTLGDSIPVILASFNDAYVSVFGKCDRTTEDFMTYIGLPLEKTFEIHNDEELTKKLVSAYLESNKKKISNNEIPLFDGVREELENLNKLGIRQGIVTSKRRESLMPTMKLLDLEDTFEIFITKDDTANHKPSGEPLEVAGKKLGIPLDRILYVGDAIGDILSAKNAKCDSVFVNWSRMPKEEILKVPPTYVINEMRDLSCIISNAEL